MDEVLTATSNFEDIAPDRYRDNSIILIAQYIAQSDCTYAFCMDAFRSNDIPSSYKRIFSFKTADFITFNQFIAFVNKAVISRNDETDIVGAGQSLDHCMNFFHGFFACRKYFIFGIQFVASCVNLIVVHINYLLTRKNFFQFSYFHCLDIIKLNGTTVWNKTL